MTSMLPAGHRIGPYQIDGVLGHGAMGEVYAAHDTQLGRAVALKTLPRAFAADADRVARFEREARVLAALNHPNIATIFGVERHDGSIALVMELIDGETIEQRLQRETRPGRGLPIADAMRIARQICDALDAAHEKGIVHRDLKPANIKITPANIVKVLDFGLAKPTDGDAAADVATRITGATLPGTVLGTAAYMSPEQARGFAVDKRADIWAFGCILYELLTGRVAFARETVTDTLAAVVAAQVDLAQLPEDTPAGMRALVGRCLDKDLKTRLRDIGDAQHYLVHDPAADRDKVTPARVTVSRRAVVAGGIGLGLLGAGIGGAMLERRARPAVAPAYQRLTFRRGMVRTARFGPDFETVYYGALWDGEACRVYSVRRDNVESAPLSLPAATPLAISGSGELALAIGDHKRGIMTYGTLARVPLAGQAPRELQEDVKYADWSADGRDLALVRRVDAGDQLEFPAGHVVLRPRNVGGGFSFPRVSPNGDSIAMFELSSRTALFGRVVVADRSGTIRSESADYFNVFGLAWRGDEVWFTAADALPLLRNTIYAMNPSGAVRVVARVAGNTTLHDIAPTGRVLIARTDDRGGIAVRVPGAANDRDLSWLDATTLADISADGGRVLFSETGVGGGPNRSCYLRDIATAAAVRLGDGEALALSPDGRWAIAHTSPPHLDLIPTGPGQARQLSRQGMRLSRARWLPNGRALVVRASTDDTPPRLYLSDIEGTDMRPITPEGISIGFNGWAISPDGSRVAIAANDGITLIAIGSGATQRVQGNGTVVGWINTGVLMADDPLSGNTIVRVDPETGQRDNWLELHPQDTAGIMSLDLRQMVFTPDGRGYGYTWHRALSDLYLVDGLT